MQHFNKRSKTEILLASLGITSHTVGRAFASRPGHTKDHHKNGTQCVRVVVWHAARLSKGPGSVWNCLWRHAFQTSPGINRKSSVLYLDPRFLSGATWPSLPKKHYNGLINQSKNVGYYRHSINN